MEDVKMSRRVTVKFDDDVYDEKEEQGDVGSASQQPAQAPAQPNPPPYKPLCVYYWPEKKTLLCNFEPARDWKEGIDKAMEAQPRRRLRFLFVVDMHQLEQVAWIPEAISTILLHIEPSIHITDRVGLVVFNETGSQVATSMDVASMSQREKMLEALVDIQHQTHGSGGTYYPALLQFLYQAIVEDDGKDKMDATHILLFTNGTIQDTSSTALDETICLPSTTLDVFSTGSLVNVSQLVRLSQHGEGGVFGYANTADDLIQWLTMRVNATTALMIASNIVLTYSPHGAESARSAYKEDTGKSSKEGDQPYGQPAKQPPLPTDPPVQQHMTQLPNLPYHWFCRPSYCLFDIPFHVADKANLAWRDAEATMQTRPINVRPVKDVPACRWEIDRLQLHHRACLAIYTNMMTHSSPVLLQHELYQVQVDVKRMINLRGMMMEKWEQIKQQTPAREKYYQKEKAALQQLDQDLNCCMVDLAQGGKWAYCWAMLDYDPYFHLYEEDGQVHMLPHPSWNARGWSALIRPASADTDVEMAGSV